MSDSGPLKAARDTIFDFSQSEHDTINLSLIDANIKNADTSSADAFHFIGVNKSFSATDPLGPGALRVIQTGGGETIEGDVNGDGKADIAIDIVDPNHGIAFTASDFVL